MQSPDQVSLLPGSDGTVIKHGSYQTLRTKEYSRLGMPEYICGVNIVDYIQILYLVV